MAIAAEQVRLFTEEEYLVREEKALDRHEYFRGRIYAMAGASREHSLVAGNCSFELKSRLKGRPCEVHGSDMRIRVSLAGLFTYADVVVSCGRPHFDQGHPANLLNPNLIVEVLSESTEAYDRGDKFALYQSLDSFTDYVLIAQDKPRVEHRRRNTNGEWILTVTHGLDASVDIVSLGISLPLAALYEQVEFQEVKLRLIEPETTDQP